LYKEKKFAFLRIVNLEKSIHLQLSVILSI